jgi:hypothetical protein
MIAVFELSLFWIVVIEAVILFLLVVNEMETAATISLFLFGGAVHFLTNINVITFFKTNWATLLQLAGIYVGVGLGWGVAKWYFFVRDIREQYVAYKAELVAKQTKDLKYCLDNRFGHDIPPRASRHKGEIVSWISYWPISVVWTLLDDFLKKLFHRVYDLFAGVFQRISNAQFKDITIERE